MKLISLHPHRIDREIGCTVQIEIDGEIQPLVVEWTKGEALWIARLIIDMVSQDLP